MPLVASGSRSSLRRDEQLVDMLSVVLDSPCVSGSRDRAWATDGCYMEILLPPSIDGNVGFAPTNGHQIWRIAEGIIHAEERFQSLLPSLLSTDYEKWVYVTTDGRHDTFSSQDAAEIAAEDAGIPRDQFVVRLVSILEQADES